MKISIHRALTEIKTISDRIDKKMHTLNAVTALKKSESAIEFNKKAKADLQSIEDLIARKLKLKKAIIKKNAETLVTINDTEMTIAEVINYKDIILLKEELLNTLTDELNAQKSAIERYNTSISNKALDLVKNAGATEAEEVKNIVENYENRNKIFLVDPVGIQHKIDSLTKEINIFSIDVDTILSEKNATTFIDV